MTLDICRLGTAASNSLDAVGPKKVSERELPQSAHSPHLSYESDLRQFERFTMICRLNAGVGVRPAAASMPRLPLPGRAAAHREPCELPMLQQFLPR
jgi:hypothetical protein